MTTISHWNLLLTNQVDKKAFIESILSKKAKNELSFLNSLNGILFSDLAIDDFIKKEYQYDTLKVSPETNRKLSTFSSGERKKEYLKYCLNKKPDFILFDNPMDHLDQASRIALTKVLEQLSEQLIIIQLVNRKTDLLPFITNNGQINASTNLIKPIDFEENKSIKSIKIQVPKPINAIEYNEEVLIQMNQVSVSYLDKKIVNQINWTIKRGEFWQLIGPNGSGKSTILSLITGENAKGYGQDLYLFGRKKGTGESIWEIKKKIGYFSTAMTDLFQKNYSLEQMILSGFFDSIGLYTEPTSLQKKNVAQWLDLIDMSSLKNKIFNHLSIGQQRLALIVRAVLKHPPLVILDEPVEGLDDENTQLITQLINTLITETNITIIYVSHRIEPTLSPQYILELVPTQEGSIGRIK